MKRRNFIVQTGKIGLGCFAGQSLVQACSTAKYIPHEIIENRITVKKSDFNADHNYVFIKNKMLPAPIFLLRIKEDEFSAVLMECTHKACEVRPFGNELHCPCHGSEFSNTGKVLEGPAEADLQKFKVTNDRNNIYIS